MAATHVTLKLSLGSGGAWFLMYSTTCCEFRRNPARDSDLMSATVPI